MIFLAIMFALAIATIAAMARLLVRAARRLMQYDDIFQNIAPILQSYSNDLSKMSSGNLDSILVDHPEILAFHRRNMQAAVAIESVIDSVTKLMPERRAAPALPRPDME